MKILRKKLSPIASMLRVCKRELRLTFADSGVAIFFLPLTIIYPLLYSLVYDPETASNEPVVVVDNDRSEVSREFVRALDATQGIEIIGYAANMEEAKRMMHEKECYGIVYFPDNFARSLGRGEQAHVSLYADVSVVLRYKVMLTALTSVTQKFSSDHQEKLARMLGADIDVIIESKQVPVGNTGMGMASAVLLFILPLILQQSLILGIFMLHGGSMERRRKNGGIDPMEIRSSCTAALLGKTLCYLIIYIVPTIYVLYYVPRFFDFPVNASLFDTVTIALPLLIASSMLGHTMKYFASNRESTFLVFVFTSIIFVFLSGVSWPRTAMSQLWYNAGNFVPGVHGSNAYVMAQSTSSTIEQQSTAIMWLWALCALYFITALLLQLYHKRRNERKLSDDIICPVEAAHESHIQE